MFVFVGHGLQVRQIDRLAHQHLHLFRHRDQLAAVVGCQYHRILQPYVFGVGQCERQIEAVHTSGIFHVLGPGAVTVRQYIDDRYAHGLMPCLAGLRINAKKGVNQQDLQYGFTIYRNKRLVQVGCLRRIGGIGKAVSTCTGRCAPRWPGSKALAADARCPIEHQRYGACLLQGLCGFIEHAGLAVGDVGRRDLHANHRGIPPLLARAGLPPGQVLVQIREDKLAVGRVVNAAVGQGFWPRQHGEVVAMYHRTQVLKQPLAVGGGAASIVFIDALGLGHAQFGGPGPGCKTQGIVHTYRRHA